ncbi:MAG: FHA domain-containing protein [Verrucomicrobia bacterium]|nr:FHA domain-containing protein [Verrucomicrobiota bacterium]
MPKIQLITQDGTKLKFELNVDRATVGRAEGNDIVVPDSSVSSRHGEILLKGDDIEVVDLGSTNGTYFGGERVERATIKPGGKFKFGSVEGLLVGEEVTPEVAKEEPSSTHADEESQSSWSGASASAAIIGGLGATPCPTSLRKGFGPKVKKKDKVASIFIMIGVISLLVCAGAIFLISRMGE